MPGPIFTTLSLDELAQQPASRSKPQSSDRGYLASVGAVAAVIIGIFFGISFSLLAPEQKIGGSGTGNRGTEIKTLHSIGLPDLSSDAQPVPAPAEQPPPPGAVASLLPLALAHRPVAREDATPANATPPQSSVSSTNEVVISTAVDAVSSTGASAVGSMANETTLVRPASVSPPQLPSSFPTATTAMTPANPPTAAEIADLLARGDSFVVIGDIASARVFYERAASAGDGRAALRMGTTFDPAFLRRAGLPRTFGYPAQARSWYRRAFDHDNEAKRRRNAGDTR